MCALQDGSSLFREQIARGKAMGALGMGMDSAQLEEPAKGRPHFFNAFYAASGGNVVPVPGGVLIKDAQGTIIGAVGISGDKSPKDEACAIEGIRAAGLRCNALNAGTPNFLKAHL